MAETTAKPQIQAQVGPRTDFQRFAVNLKRTDLGVKFGRRLFSPEGRGLSPADIVASLRALGLDIPREVQLTLDGAQLLATGQAAVGAARDFSDVAEFEGNFEAIKSVTTPTAGTVKLLSRLASELGWIDKNSGAVQSVNFGANVALLIASGGMNIGAWVGLALDFGMNEAKMKMKAQSIANGILAENYRSLITPQAAAAALVVKDYQEKKMSTLGFVGRMAEAAPDLWPQFFPEFGSWAPVYDRVLYTTGSTKSWYGSTQNANARMVWKSIHGLTGDKLREWIIYGLVSPVLYPFYLANRQYRAQGKASLFDLALLSTLTPLNKISRFTDASYFLNSCMLSPYDFRDDVIQRRLSEIKDPNPNAAVTTGVRFDGQNILSKGERDRIAKERFTFQNRDAFLQADRAGRIDVLRMSPEINAWLKEHYTYPAIEFSKEDASWFSVANVVKRGTNAEVEVIREGSVADWRIIRNYIGALGMIDEIRNDGFFAEWGMDDGVLGTGTFENYNFFEDIDFFESEQRRLQMISMLRQINTLATANVAGFYNTTPDKLVRLSDPNTQGPALIGVR